MIVAHVRDQEGRHDAMIRAFVERSRENRGLATDQLLNAVFLRTAGVREDDESWDELLVTGPDGCGIPNQAPTCADALLR